MTFVPYKVGSRDPEMTASVANIAQILTLFRLQPTLFPYLGILFFVLGTHIHQLLPSSNHQHIIIHSAQFIYFYKRRKWNWLSHQQSSHSARTTCVICHQVLLSEAAYICIVFERHVMLPIAKYNANVLLLKHRIFYIKVQERGTCNPWVIPYLLPFILFLLMQENGYSKQHNSPGSAENHPFLLRHLLRRFRRRGKITS